MTPEEFNGEFGDAHGMEHDAHGAATSPCVIAAAWRDLGDPRGAADIERAHEEALREHRPGQWVAMAEERAESRGITTAALWREAMHAHLGAPREAT